VFGLAAVFSLARLVPSTPAHCAPRCDPRDLNPIDRPVAGRWDPRWGTASDVGNIALGAGAGLVLLVSEGVLPALNDLLVIAETSLLASAVSGLAALPTRRPRPFLYGDKAPLEKRQGGDAALSFVSGHTSSSFAIAVSSFAALRHLYPRSAVPWVTLGVGLAGASSVGVARVLAGQHFPTDVLTGAIVGSALGVLVPALHERKVAIVPQLTPTSRGVLFLRAF
jgi:membrane-associated phospholipid phosphatase